MWEVKTQKTKNVFAQSITKLKTIYCSNNAGAIFGFLFFTFL